MVKAYSMPLSISAGYLVVLALSHWRAGWNTQTVAVVLTGLVVIWYTWETMNLGRETRRLAEIQLRPFVILEFAPDHFEMTNIGHGPALNVKVLDVDVDKDFGISIRFPEAMAVLRPGETAQVKAKSFRNCHSAGDFFVAHLNPNYANRILPIRIQFQDVEFRRYVVEEHVVPGELRIVELR